MADDKLTLFDDILRKIEAQMQAEGYPVKIVSRMRTAAQQKKLFDQGSSTTTLDGTTKISHHQAGTGADFAFLVNGQPSFNAKHPWKRLGEIAKENGLTWGGDWETPYDPGHVQLGGNLPGTAIGERQVPRGSQARGTTTSTTPVTPAPSSNRSADWLQSRVNEGRTPTPPQPSAVVRRALVAPVSAAPAPAPREEATIGPQAPGMLQSLMQRMLGSQRAVETPPEPTAAVPPPSPPVQAQAPPPPPPPPPPPQASAMPQDTPQPTAAASSKATVFDPISGTMVTAAEARRLIATRRNDGTGGTTVPSALSGPGGAPGEVFSAPSGAAGSVPDMRPTGGEMLNALPEVAATAASFLPQTALPANLMKAGPVVRSLMRMLTPGVAAGGGEAARQTLQGEDIDMGQMAERGIVNALPGVVGEAGQAATTFGMSRIKSAVTAGRSTTTGKAITGPIGNRSAPVGKAATNAARAPLTAVTATRLAATAAKYNATVSAAGVAKLNARSVALENKILQIRDPKLAAAAKKELDELDALIPEIQAVVDKGQNASLPRFAAGAGITAGLVGGGGTILGLDPQTAATLGMLIGIPVGALEASPQARMIAGQLLKYGAPAGKSVEATIRAMLAHEQATAPTPPATGAKP